MCMKKKNKIFGFKQSNIDGTEKIFSSSINTTLPSSYSYVKYLPNVWNQGDKPYCVPYSISTYLNWRENFKNSTKIDNKVNYSEIYKIKTTEGEGMTFKEAFSYLKHHGVSFEKGNMLINNYALVRNIMSLKYAIILNGPCFGALPVYNTNKEFWKSSNNDNFLGYHAISIVGYNEQGFIIRNSWGKSFGENGYTLIKYEDINKFIEIWTIIH